jgi:GMP synthase (glutamine-hydrolysing)
MPIIILQHVATEGPGRLGPILRDHAHQLDFRRVDMHGASAIPNDFDGVDAVVSLGGPMNVGDDLPWMSKEIDFLKEAHQRQLPVLGVCLGAQLIAKSLGGEVGPSGPAPSAPEFGFASVNQTLAGNTDRILAGVPWQTHQFQAHGQEIKKLPDGAILLQTSPACKVQTFCAGLRTYGFQYHFESTRSDIDTFLADPWSQDLMRTLNLSPAAVRASLDTYLEPYARLGNRICANIANYMFPMLKKLRA